MAYRREVVQHCRVDHLAVTHGFNQATYVDGWKESMRSKMAGEDKATQRVRIGRSEASPASSQFMVAVLILVCVETADAERSANSK